MRSDSGALALSLRNRNPDYLPPDWHDKRGSLWREDTIDNYLLNHVAFGSELKLRSKEMAENVDEATSAVADATKRFSAALTAMVEKEKAVAESAKRASGSVRDSATRLGDALARLEKVADFDRLERLANLLERMSNSLESISSLQCDGRLERVAELLGEKKRSAA